MSTIGELVAIDLHAEGEPGRVVLSGVPHVPGDSMFAKMRYLEQNLDGLRRLMLREPRGYPAANCNLLLPPTDPRAVAGYVILEQVEYAPMSGSNTICVATALIEMGLVEVHEPVTEFVLESPAGLIGITAQVEAGHATRITFENVPSFAMALDVPIEVPELGRVWVDVAWGGMIFVIADAAALGLPLVPERAGALVRAGEMIKAATREQAPQVHPSQPD
ncbi:MAG TPA: proline racemase family protein, partial [Candidatus Dormibacteraeota bacterium]